MGKVWVVLLIVLGIFILTCGLILFIFTGASYEDLIAKAMETEDPSLCYKIPFYRMETNEHGSILGPNYIWIDSYRERCLLGSTASGLKLHNIKNKAIEMKDPTLCLTLSESYPESNGNVVWSCLVNYIDVTKDDSACDLFSQIGYNASDTGRCGNN